MELGDIAFAPYVRRWRTALADLPAEGYGVLVDAITCRQAERLGVVVDDWTSSDAAALERARALLDEVDCDGREALWDEPHTLGWFHQHFGEVERDASNRAHTRDEEKHASGTVTTQLYTPRWVADFLAKTCLDTVSDTASTPREHRCGGILPSDSVSGTASTPREHRCGGILPSDSVSGTASTPREHRCGGILPSDSVSGTASTPRELRCGGILPSLTVCDPAVGGGQMLLAALDDLISRGVEPADAAARLYGVDLDTRAVDVARRALALAVARHLGRRDEAAEAAIQANVRVADGLFDELGEFDVVITNPPYMGSRSMPAALKERIRATYRPFHADLYTAFIRRCHELSTHTVGVLAQQTVWFLSRFRKARSWLLDHGELVAFMHLGAHAFANLNGEKANVVAFVQSRAGAGEPTEFIDLRAYSDAAAKRDAFVERRDEHTRREPATAFDALPGRVLAHWLPQRLRAHFDGGRTLADLADIPGSQNKTGKNRRYVKNWREVDPGELRSAPEIVGEAGADDGRWVFYSKGGRYAPWWGNWHNVVDWSDEARAFYADNRTSNLLAQKWWFREGICYTDFGGRTFNARLMPRGCVFDMAGPAIFPHDPDDLYVLLAVLNSTPVRALLNAMNPSLHYQVRDLRNLPVPEWSADLAAELAGRARRLVDGMKEVACFVDDSPRSLCRDTADAEQVRAFGAECATLEREVDEMVCELYGCSELVESGERPVHDYLGRFEK
ncbi:hypothetical protein FIV42_14860 [Persicimonas caeni]|uniref:site-specific DNA-methyltransferase (adenine-specific) n=1 Tax=Persicimonas caeni TaxID=2292766 RepID=A0A4Y6PUH6_PERCE|nr:N-6 DNA methylase [Persicimonas caeni]QDG51972.1 hypothetical protein FIV42_14860 [Persicimonas caeni]QED33193.1 N-6 DNA methylase [Persicimonas caeni]